MQVESRTAFPALYQLLTTRQTDSENCRSVSRKYLLEIAASRDTTQPFRKKIQIDTETIRMVSSDLIEWKHSYFLPFKVWATPSKMKLTPWLRHLSSHAKLLLEAFGVQFSKCQKKKNKKKAPAKLEGLRNLHSSAGHTKLIKKQIHENTAHLSVGAINTADWQTWSTVESGPTLAGFLSNSQLFSRERERQSAMQTRNPSDPARFRPREKKKPKPKQQRQ